MSFTPSCQKVFVVGHPRSGTSWLFQMLNDHPALLGINGESHVYEVIYQPFTYLHQLDFVQRLSNAKHLRTHYGLWPTLAGLRTDDLWRGILTSHYIWKKLHPSIGIHTLINRKPLESLIQIAKSSSVGQDLDKAEVLIRLVLEHFFEANRNRDSEFLIEKTPMHIRYAKQILKKFPEAVVIEIIRDGRDVCASMQARSQNPKSSWARRRTLEIIKTWKECLDYGDEIRSDATISDRFYSVQYESLQKAGVADIAKVFDFIGVPYSWNQVESIVENRHINRIKTKGHGLHVNKGLVGNWQKALTPQDIDLWHHQAGEVLERLGYQQVSS